MTSLKEKSALRKSNMLSKHVIFRSLSPQSACPRWSGRNSGRLLLAHGHVCKGFMMPGHLEISHCQHSAQSPPRAPTLSPSGPAAKLYIPSALWGAPAAGDPPGLSEPANGLLHVPKLGLRQGIDLARFVFLVPLFCKNLLKAEAQAAAHCCCLGGKREFSVGPTPRTASLASLSSGLTTDKALPAEGSFCERLRGPGSHARATVNSG